MRGRRRRKRPPGGLPTPQLDRLALPRQVDRRVRLGRSEGESMRGRGNGVRWGTEQEPAPTTNPPRRLAIFFFSPLLLLPPACLPAQFSLCCPLLIASAASAAAAAAATATPTAAAV
ncbi:hypothetical protein ABZP36_019140 [Zizania latifolia]